VSSPRYRIDAAWNRKVTKIVIQAAREISGLAVASVPSSAREAA